MIRRFFACVIFLLAFTSLNAQPTLDSQIAELARQLNLWRINLGLGPLVYNPLLERMAVYQADHLLRQPSIPPDIHAGPDGEHPRERSQLPQFAWATYGHPELMSVTEIAAIGSIESAINFWQNSDIHNRSVTNPTYREIGIAAYEYGDDIMFIVVLGGRPNVIPVLMDLENKQLYMTNERAEWTGEWIGEITEYRYLDAEEQPITDWFEWDRIIDIPDELIETAVYIQYKDANNTRAKYELIFNPVWSELEIPEVFVIPPTATPESVVDGGSTDAEVETETTTESTESGSSVFATNTPMATPTFTPSPIPTLTPFPTFTPTATPLPKSLLLTYTDELFVLYNNGSDVIDLSASRFQREDIGFVGSFWEEVVDGLNISAFPSQQCLMIQPENGLTYEAPAECRAVRSIVQEPDPRYFWLGDFEMLIDGQVVGTCDGEAGTCTIVFP